MPPDTVVQEDEIEGWPGGAGEGGGAPSRRRPSHNPRRMAVRSAPVIEDGGPDGLLWPPYRTQSEELWEIPRF
eukprot:2900106-Prymnesium_polylepis.1